MWMIRTLETSITIYGGDFSWQRLVATSGGEV